jgi:recombination protein RecT
MSTEIQIHETFKPVVSRLMAFMDQETIMKECNYAMQSFNKNNYLNSSTTASKQQAILNVAQIGLTLNPVLKYAYLVPRYTGGQVECFLEPSYQGIVKLITDTGSAKNVYAHPVFEGDIFDVVLGTATNVIHRPQFKSKNLTHVYAVANLHDGSQMIEVMHVDEVFAIRDKSESYKSFKDGKTKSCIWVDHESEMSRKTVIKRLCKYLPKTEMWDKLAKAIDLDNSDYAASDDQISYIESLLTNANIDPDIQGRYYREIQDSLTASRASELIEYLRNNQLDAISAGHNYGAKEIAEKINAQIDEPKGE